jgi:HSP20 family protein
MQDKRCPFVFDVFESFIKNFPFDRKERSEVNLFRESFEEMIKRFEKTMPAEFIGSVSEDITSPSIIRRHSPLVYGISFMAKPGKDNIFREFGNVSPYYRGLEPSKGREPLVDVISEKNSHKIFVELPGVEKDNVKLDVAEDSVEITTINEKKFYKIIYFDSPVDQDSVKASFRNGVLTVELEKKEKRKGKDIKID